MLSVGKTFQKAALSFVFLAAAGPLPFLRNAACAQQSPPVPHLTFKAVDPKEKGERSLSLLAKKLIAHGPLLFSKADAAAKAAANKTSAEVLKAMKNAPAPGAPPLGVRGGLSDDVVTARRGEGVKPLAPTVASINISGQSDPNFTPSDSTGAIGPARFIQLVNSQAALYDTTNNGTLLASGSLNGLAGNPVATIFDPQIIWDTTSARFYYTMLEFLSASDFRLAFGFSKSPLVVDVSSAWCHYEIGFGPIFPDFPKLGDSQDFAIIGVNTFFPTLSNGTGVGGMFAGSDLIAISKPPNGQITCPSPGTFKFGAAFNLVDSTGKQVFTPVPANQIYGVGTPPPAGFVIARNGVLSVPSNKLWFFNVTKGSGGEPVFGSARGLTLPFTYAIPPAAAQPMVSQLLDTSDARMTQAVQAFRPLRGKHSFWTQNTRLSPVNPAFSVVQVYEIDPVPSSPVLLGSFFVFSSTGFRFNGSVSPDRQTPFGNPEKFGDSWVFQYNASSASLFPSIHAGSSLKGAPVQFLVPVVNPGQTYVDGSCPNAGDTCRWGDYSGASPDPAPGILGVLDSGVVWGTNQIPLSPAPPPPPVGNWGTQIFALTP